MRKQIGQFLQYMRVERGASDHTLKGYREDLHALAEYLADEDGRSPAAWQHYDCGTPRICRCPARGRIREVLDRAPPCLTEKFLSFWPARELVEDESGEGAAESA